ncbi:MAG: helix-turn-helix domain-containing protein [Sulfitobacter sp.]
MSEILDCDPNKGFVAFPVSLFDLDLTPGAFRTLAELCRMANTSGQCWPSLAQLGRRLGRSRASVSSYINELREAGVLTTQEQKMANGYNYRLRYTVTFWKEWRAGLSKGAKKPAASTVQKAERRVQPTERPLETKNHIHKNQLLCSKSPDLVSDWGALVGSAPYPEFTAWPTEALIAETEGLVDAHREPPQLISADIAEGLADFTRAKGLENIAPTEIDKIAPRVVSLAILQSLLDALEKCWQPHWKKPPNSYQMLRLLDNAATLPDTSSQRKLLKSYLRRWKLHQRSLPSAAIHSKVAA